MRLLKLDAIPSTNDFLKELAANQALADFTIVSAETQSAGRGQMGAKWDAEPGKNLTFSIFLRNHVNDISQIFQLNVRVSVAVYAALRNHVETIAVKWPNDVMAADKKIGGILIENLVRGNSINSVVGIGLNVNQRDFNGLPNASSLSVQTGKEYDRDQLLKSIVQEIRQILSVPIEEVWQCYEEILFRRGIVSKFRAGNVKFSGIISQVSPDGRLIVDTSSGRRSFSLKEITMLY